MKKINKKDIITFICIFVITCLIFMPILIGHYSTDTYRLVEMGYKKYSIEYSLNDGRIFMSLIGLLADKININIDAYVIILTTLSIMVSCICVMKIQKIITKNNPRGNILITTLISYIIVMNFMYLENLYFTECIVMAISIMLFITAANDLNNDENILKIFILVLLGTFCYQGTINIFITFYFVLALIKYKKINKKIVKNIVIIAFICLLSVAINMLQINICGKIFGMTQDRTGNINNIFNNMIYIIANIYKIIINTSDLFPRYVLLGIYTITLIITIAYDAIKVKQYDNSFNIILIALVAIISSVAINVVSLSSFALGRMVFSVGALMGLVFMYLYCATNIFEEKNHFKLLINIALGFYVICLLSNETNILYQHKKANELDKKECKTVGEYIEQYEKENNIEVKKIAYVYDKNITWCYNELSHKSLFTHRALMIWWCNVDAINYYTNRNLEEVQMPRKIYDEYFKNKDWNELNKEQFVFIDDTLYYCIY